MNVIALALVGFNPGGLERVVAELCNRWAVYDEVECHIITLSKKKSFYFIDQRVKLHQPSFDLKQFNKAVALPKLFFYFRRSIKMISPDALLTFAGEYNSFFVLSTFGINIKRFCAERARPGISYGQIQDLINPFVYKYLCNGLVVQTTKAKGHLSKSTKHSNIATIPNPIREIKCSISDKAKVILNVGRFTKTKNQEKLAKIYSGIKTTNWNLSFLGDGQLLQKLKNKYASEDISFHGNVKEIDKYYAKCSIFAFTSTSEGFPNALGEAMAAGCACIAYDCVTGPSDIVDDGINGFLIPVGDEKQYIEKLQLLMENSDLRRRFGEAAREKMKDFEAGKIARKFYEFISQPLK